MVIAIQNRNQQSKPLFILQSSICSADMRIGAILIIWRNGKQESVDEIKNESVVKAIKTILI